MIKIQRYKAAAVLIALSAAFSSHAVAGDYGEALAAVLDAQADEAKARYDARHPGETLKFFGIKPGMTVVEGLPGGGWYSRILLPYLGEEGHLVGANTRIPCGHCLASSAMSASKNSEPGKPTGPQKLRSGGR